MNLVASNLRQFLISTFEGILSLKKYFASEYFDRQISFLFIFFLRESSPVKNQWYKRIRPREVSRRILRSKSFSLGTFPDVVGQNNKEHAKNAKACAIIKHYANNWSWRANYAKGRCKESFWLELFPLVLIQSHTLTSRPEENPGLRGRMWDSKARLRKIKSPKNRGQREKKKRSDKVVLFHRQKS